VSSAHRVQDTNLEIKTIRNKGLLLLKQLFKKNYFFTPRPISMRRWPSLAPMLPESSHIKNRMGIFERLFKKMSHMPGGQPLFVRKSRVCISIFARGIAAGDDETGTA
jgi:hypothetical protein